MSQHDGLLLPGAAAGDRSAWWSPRSTGGWLRPDRARRLVALSLVPLGGSAILVSATSEHLAHPWGAAAYKAYLVAAPVLVGLLWWRRRPGSGVGPLLVAFGYVSWLVALRGADDPLAYTIGAVADAPATALALYLCLAFPAGRLQTAVERALMAILAAALAVFFGALVLLAPVLIGTEPFSVCAGACPGNPLQMAARPELVDTATTAVTYVGLAVVLGIAVVWARRLRVATRPQRRALVPVACSSLLLVPALFTYYFALLVLDVGPATADVLGWLLVAAIVVFPLGFAAALLVTDLFARRALRRLLRDVAGRPELDRWRDELAVALDDPSVRIARRDQGTGRFFEADGSELAPPADGSGTLWVPVASGEREVGALVVDDALAREPELLDAAAAATLLALEGIALEDALRASRARLRRVGDAQRRRIERELHDGPERRLAALRARLAEAEAPRGFEGFERELETALEELRTVSHGIFPRLLAHEGVAAALHPVCRAAAIPVVLDATEFGRQTEAIEIAVYFCCLEALQNVAKHAGPGAHAVIRLADGDGGVRFTVDDDGGGFDIDAVERGLGLTSLADRLAAVGGQLRIDSAPGRGTRVTGRIPR